MSDFLTNLVARSLGTAPVLRPRVTSLFESVQGAAAPLEKPSDDRNPETIELEEKALAGSEKHPPSRRVHPPMPVLAEQETADAERDDVPAVPVAGRLPESARDPVPNAPAERVIEKLETRVLAESHQPAKNQPLAPASEIHSAPQPVKQTNISPLNRLHQQVEHCGQLVPPKLTPEIRVPELMASIPPRQQRRNDQHNALPSASHESEPTVQVTIGRVEVRATREASPPRGRTPTSSPVMSLDEYLRKRAQRAGQ